MDRCMLCPLLRFGCDVVFVSSLSFGLHVCDVRPPLLDFLCAFD
jgi:hypothetical protein